MASERTGYSVRSSKLKREMQEVPGRSESIGGYREFVKRLATSGRFVESGGDPLPPKGDKKRAKAKKAGAPTRRK